ncbi:DUF2062 domain-containing protein [Pistricoccus aurantiacus]|uniref:DUF2062 domain-containing protein n=1 Tax=Pistricoccus aurantiacus TaxID=1883414 RepID=A0A5B8SZE2_9GAMM|nr:DUF2062 domain-containing protein [Pistricoccus aurantiacus]QEA40170.1 DUF2062 domain-containing protein [Pistricoccus aurantiacus]
MPRRFLQRYLPHPDALRRKSSLRFMGRLIGDTSLWMLSRRSVANACMVGLFSALLPIPFQMMVSALGAWLLRCNLPLCMALVWITNPLTMPLIFYMNYRLGAWTLGNPVREVPDQLSTEWLVSQMQHILPPLLLGSLMAAVSIGLIANLLVRLIWRWQVARSWKRRQRRRIRPKAIDPEQTRQESACPHPDAAHDPDGPPSPYRE